MTSVKLHLDVHTRISNLCLLDVHLVVILIMNSKHLFSTHTFGPLQKNLACYSKSQSINSESMLLRISLHRRNRNQAFESTKDLIVSRIVGDLVCLDNT